MLQIVKKTGGILLALLVCACHSSVPCTQSPDNTLKVKLVTPTDGSYGKASFFVEYKGDSLFPLSELGLETDVRKFVGNVKLKSVSAPIRIVDDYQMITGKRSHCMNKASERTYVLENDKGQVLEVTFRAYPNGVAFKYSLPAFSEDEHWMEEHTTYAVPQGKNRWIQQYDPGYERLFPLSTDGTLAGRPNACLWGYPALVEYADKLFMLITEANIRRGNCSSLLNNGESREKYVVQLADKNFSSKEAWNSPWRLLMVGSLSDIVESTLVTDVSDPSKVEDTEWIKPGTVAWIYWAYNHGSKDYQRLKEYIDLAATMKWPYDLIDWEWNEMGNGGTIEEVAHYALSRGVKPLLWYNSSTSWIGPGPLFRLNKKEAREKEYQWLSKMGFAGVKIDFFSGDSISTMNYYMDLLEDAAQYKLMLNFHGATIPRGWQRTYPHLMSVEGVYGAEWYNNTPMLTNAAAEHNATLPFTRNVVGPMDYTPGTFSDSQHPHITTYAHELALPVLFESAFQHMPDRPSVYSSMPDPVKELLSQLPTTWDDTKLLAGYPGKEVVMARRKGKVWYIAGINGTNEPQMLHFSLQALKQTGKVYTLFKDGADDRSFSIEENQPLPKTHVEMEIACRPRGGFVTVIK